MEGGDDGSESSHDEDESAGWLRRRYLAAVMALSGSPVMIHLYKNDPVRARFAAKICKILDKTLCVRAVTRAGG